MIFARMMPGKSARINCSKGSGKTEKAGSLAARRGYAQENQAGFLFMSVNTRTFRQGRNYYHLRAPKEFDFAKGHKPFRYLGIVDGYSYFIAPTGLVEVLKQEMLEGIDLAVHIAQKPARLSNLPVGSNADVLKKRFKVYMQENA